NTRENVVQKSCPPIVDSSYKVLEVAQDKNQHAKKNEDRKIELAQFWNYFLKRMKNMLPSTFGFVEGAGFFYGLDLVARTIAPITARRMANWNKVAHETVCEPELQSADPHTKISIAEQAGIVKSGFDLMGWKNFAPIVIFVGHGSQSTNNPF